MKRNLILLIICIVIAGVYFWDQYRIEQKKEREEKAKQLVELSQDEVKEISIQKDETIEAVKKDDSWTIVEPFETGGDKSNWNSIARTYADGKLQRVVTEDADNLKAFGLEEPSIAVSLAGVEGATSSTILLGDQTPTAGKYYAMVKGTSDVVTVMSTMYNNVDKSLFDMRDKNLLALENNKIRRIEIAHSSLDVTVEKKGEDDWIITDPVQARADDSKMTSVINNVKNSQIKQFIDENPENLEAYGLVDPATKLVFWSGEPGNESSWAAQALLIGATSADELWYAKREGQKNVFAVSSSDFKDIPKTLMDLRDKKLTDFSSWEVKRATISAADEVIVEVSKSAGDWFMVQPEEGKADYTSVSEMVRGLIDLEIAQFVDGTTEEYGLDSPSIVFNLETDEDSQTIQLAGPKEMNGAEWYFGARTEPLEIYSIKAESIQESLNKAQSLQLEEEPQVLPENIQQATGPLQEAPESRQGATESIQEATRAQETDGTQ